MKIKLLLFIALSAGIVEGYEYGFGLGLSGAMKYQAFIFYPNISYYNSSKFALSQFSIDFMLMDTHTKENHHALLFSGIGYAPLFQINDIGLYIGPKIGFWVNNIIEGQGTSLSLPSSQVYVQNTYWIGNDVYVYKKDETNLLFGGLLLKYFIGEDRYRFLVSNQYLFGQTLIPDHSMIDLTNEHVSKRFCYMVSLTIEGGVFFTKRDNKKKKHLFLIEPYSPNKF
jgi:hypothetical protein